MIPNSNYTKYMKSENVPVAGQCYTTSPLVPSQNTFFEQHHKH